MWHGTSHCGASRVTRNIGCSRRDDVGAARLLVDAVVHDVDERGVPQGGRGPRLSNEAARKEQAVQIADVQKLLGEGFEKRPAQELAKQR